MTRVLCLALTVNAALLAANLFREPAARALQGAGGAVAASGDVNGSGGIDISDAVFLLNWLFSGGPDPAPCAGGAGLPDTGTAQCYDCDGNVVPCKSCVGQPRSCDGFTDPSLVLQDAMQGAGCPNDANRFTDNGDGTVTDHCTGLMWQKDTADLNGAPTINWCGALAFCRNLSFAGHDDWRLPNIRELQSIVDYGRFGPAIDPVFGALLAFYWSSTSNAAVPEEALIVGFGDGLAMPGGKNNGSRVRAVRNAP